jgi:uncharacterized protein
MLSLVSLPVSTPLSMETTPSKLWRYDPEPEDVLALADHDPMIAALLDTRAFLRLKDICFLGALDYTFIKTHKKRFSRYQHSLGVAILALTYARLAKLSLTETRVLAAAALLHDLGHAPFSHTLEPVFKTAFGLNHHTATEIVLKGQSPLGRDVLNTLRRYGLDVIDILALYASEPEAYHGLLTGPINIDTIDGICRSYRYAFPNPKILARTNAQNVSHHPLSVLRAAYCRETPEHQACVDAFWQLKKDAYTRLIQSKAGLASDTAYQKYAQENIRRLSEDDVYSTESKLQKRLDFSKVSYSTKPLNAVVRDFYIEQEVDFFSRHDSERYRQRKSVKTVPMPLLDLSARLEQYAFLL